MVSTRKVWLGLLAVAAALLTAVSAAQDFPTLSGQSGRVGKTLDPQTYTPGVSNLIWFYPNGVNRPGTLIRDNPSNATLRSPNVASWIAPPVDQEASYFYMAPRTFPLNGTEDQVTGAVATDPFRPGQQTPGYEYALSVPSALGSHNNPTTTALPGQLKTFQWKIDPTVENPGAPNLNYQLYVWLPNGPTGPFGGPLVYPNRFYVFTIDFGNGLRWVDVVDTNFAGQGWVRLGNGGKATDQIFPYTGTPITVTLYNTMWRDEFDNILEDTTVPRAVYADTVMAVPDNGSITATPVVKQIDTGTTLEDVTVSAINKHSATFVNNKSATITTPEVDAFFTNGLGPNLNAPIWKWTPLEVTPYTTPLDNTDVGVTNGGSWPANTTANHFGANYFEQTTVNTPGTETSVTYSPTLEDGDYLIQIYCGGDQGTETFGQQVTVNVQEGANPVQTFTLDQHVAGWVTLSNQRFQHRGSIGEDLKVSITNLSTLPADAGKFAYADEVRFIGSFNTSINATPVMTKAFITPPGGGTPVEKEVVVVACDDGHIYCLDAIGNGNGTTNLIWAYPSILPTGAPISDDPNSDANEDGVGIIAKMPVNGFGLSSPLVERIGGVDYCYVAARDGRVYCINMAGRGDGTSQRVGTTSRRWSYPDDFPAFQRLPLTPGFGGSVSFSTTTQGPTLFVPASEGRIYALDALGNTANKTTTTRWTYPLKTDATLGAVTTSPTVDFGRVYFGTARLNDTVPGQFYALNADTGAFVWKFEGDPNTAEADNFVGGACTATSAQLSPPANLPNMIFCANQNLFVYGLDADTGALLWQTAELNSPVSQHLLFAWQNVPDLTGTAVPFPVVVVPTDDGRFMSLFARQADVNVDNLKLAWGYQSASDSLTASMSNGRNFMFGADMAGNLFSFGNGTGVVGGMGSPPGQGVIPPNNPVAQLFRNSKIVRISVDGYRKLRESDLGANANGDVGTITHDQALTFVINRPAFEWGETAYFLVYDFPFLDQDPVGNPVNPPIVQFQIGIEGASVRQFGVQAKQFKPSGQPNGEGYAILAFPIQGSGPTSIPPGSATVKYSFSTAASNVNGQMENIASSKTNVFGVANPIGIIMPDPNTGGQGGGVRTFGENTDPTTPERLRNGSPNMPAGGTQGGRLATSGGVIGNGQTGTASFWVTDMSMLTLLKGPARGLENVRVTRPEMAWQGGIAAVVKPIDQFLYPGFEDLPAEFPNHSIDYPNVGRENLRATKDPLGTAENAFVSTSGVSLDPPKPFDEVNVPNRTIHPVLFQLDYDVPRFQPANNDPVNLYFQETGGSFIPSGYLARFNVFVDSNANSTLDSISGRREAYRAFTSSFAVSVDDRLAVSNPTVDLGTLGETTGYSPLAPGATNGVSMSPWLTGTATFPLNTITTSNQDYVDLFKPFTVQNLGNVNTLNARLAKSVVGGPLPGPWPIISNTVDELGWLDASRYVWTNFDFTYGLMPKVLLQKARVGDQFPTELSTNPRRRFNQNLGTPESLLFPAGPTGDAAKPRIAVSLPLGFPVGLYSQRMVVIDDLIPSSLTGTGDQALEVDANNNGQEVMSNPTFELKFGVREFRLTNNFTKATAPAIDYPQAAVNGLNLNYANLQPTGIRTPAGSVLVAWTSPRPSYGSTPPPAPVTDPDYRIYIATVQGQAPNGAGSPLDNLGNFTPAANDRWFRQEIGPYPNLPNYDGLFQSSASENVIVGSEKFGAPSMPTLGLIDPMGGANFTFSKMAFVGQAEKQASSGRTTEYRIMTADVTVNASGAVTVANLHAMPTDPNTPKGRPSVYQTQNGAAIFYSEAGTGQGQIFFTVTDGTNFSRPVSLPMGNGFEELGSPSVVLRQYTGAGGAKPLIEITFVGKLRGRPNSEVFYGRMLTTTTSVNGNNVNPAPGSTLFLNTRFGEGLTPDGETGSYRAQGVVWNTAGATPFAVYEQINGGAPVNIVNGPMTIDRATGLVRFDTSLGGQCYVDTNLGTVRFSSSLPPKNAQILLDYTPRFLRVSESNVAGHSGPTVLWDDRVAGDVSNYSYWFNLNSGGGISNVPPTATPRPARYFMTYTRAASGAGQAARPYWKTLRLGVQLKYKIYTDAGGNITNLSVTGANGPVQVDPSNGRIYFQASEEDKTVTVNYTSIDESTGQPIAVAAETYPVSLIVERSESPVPIDQAVNESSISPFLDPFEANPRQPGLVWMFYVSTRTGGPDLYFQTMAPRFTPIVKK